MKRLIVIFITLILALQTNAIGIEFDPGCQMEMSGMHGQMDMDEQMMDCCDTNCTCTLMSFSNPVTLPDELVERSLLSTTAISTWLFTIKEASPGSLNPPPISA